MADGQQKGIRGVGYLRENAAVTEDQAEIFQPQVFLMKNWKYFIPQSYSRNNKYKHLTPIHAKTPYQINNRLLGVNGIKDYMNISRSSLEAFLRPRIRIYKVYNDGTEIPFKLRFLSSVSEVRKNLKSTTAMLGAAMDGKLAAAATDFTWKRSGNTVAEWRNSIEASLKFSISNPQLLDVPFYGDEYYRATKNGEHISEQDLKNQGKSSKLKDLITRPPLTVPNIPTAEELEQGPPRETMPNPDYYELKVVVGWVLRDKVTPPREDRKKYQKIIEQQTTTLMLSCYDHNIEFAPSAAKTTVHIPMSLDVSFIGSIPNMLSELSAFRPPEPNSLHPHGGAISVDFNKEQLQEEYSSIIKELIERKNIYYHKIIKHDVIVGFDIDKQKEIYNAVFKIKKGDSVEQSDAEEMRKATESAATEDSDVLIENLRDLRTGSKEGFNLQWFYMGDLIDVVLSRMYKNTQLTQMIKDIKFLVGTIVLYDNKGEPWSVNICDFPISLETFTLWFREKILSKKVATISVSSFLNNVFNSLIKGGYGPLSQINKEITLPQLAFSTFSLPKKNNQEPIFEANGHAGGGNAYHVSDVVFDNLGNTNEIDKPHSNYFLINSIGGRIGFGGVGDEDKDSKKGIPHINSLRRGPAESISFSKVDNPALTLVNIRRAAGASAANGVLRNIYNANLSLIGTPTLKPGTLLYIDPKSIGLGNNLYNMLGIGGYFTVVSSTNNVDFNNAFNTEIECQWVSFGQGDTQEPRELQESTFDSEEQQRKSSMSARID